jgi:predicted phosphodiesterase
MRIILISDTHKKHENVILPVGDLIIHAGDVSSRGTYGEILNFLHWFKNLPYICIKFSLQVIMILC